jgi:hypothetical protein
MPSEFRVEKIRAAATLTLSNGASLVGYFFVAGASARHAGVERIADVLNGADRFFPFEVIDAGGGPRTGLYNRDHVVLVMLASGDEARDSGYDVAAPRRVSMLLSNNVRITGFVRVEQPYGHDRLSDYARGSRQFEYVEAATATFIVNLRHVVELTESSDQ